MEYHSNCYSLDSKKKTMVMVPWTSLVLFLVPRRRTLLLDETNNSCQKCAAFLQSQNGAEYVTGRQTTLTATTSRDGQETRNTQTALQSISSRRHVLKSLLVTSAVVSSGAPLAATAADNTKQQDSVSTTTPTTIDEPDFSCLSDLGPIPEDSVRIYLCRHGQTENNRLRLVQGSRMNPPLNDNGVEQAQRLGKALAAASVPPTALFHSPLQRARQTAEIAATALQQSTTATTTVTVPTGILSSMREVDFGPTTDGTSVKQATWQMKATYAQWSIGKLNVKMASDGESGREVLARVEQATQDLLQQAIQSPTRCIGVVSHSSFLRTLLATLQNVSLTKVATITVKNASVSVVDIKRDGSRVQLGPKSILLGGWFSQADASFSLSYPTSTVLRVNETRHLGRLGTYS